MTGISPSTVSARCQGLDERVQTFRERVLAGSSPDVWLEAQSWQVREGDRVQRRACVIATGVSPSGDREM
jgi:transposase-like protein